MSIRITINGKDFPLERVKQWELNRAVAVYRFLQSRLKPEDLQSLPTKYKLVKKSSPSQDKLAWIHAVQRNLDPEQVKSLFTKELSRGAAITRFMNFISRGRKHCTIEMHVEGLDAQKFIKYADNKMLSARVEDRDFCLSACPDHYLIRGAGHSVMEVIETTGGAPYPVQFFLTQGDETGLTVPRNEAFQFQMTGTARLPNGTVVGGIRHQFRPTNSGFNVIFGVEFPSATTNFIVRQHQFHLACEWTNWLNFFAIDSASSC
jgi:hypothetical protein